MFHKKIQLIFICFLTVSACVPMTAFSVMQSSNYEVQFDSVNFGGGYSSSTSYQLHDTAGEVGSGNSSSATYQMRAGYQQMNSAYIAINNQSLVDLGNSPGLVVSNVSSSTVVNVKTDSYGGYQLTIRASTTPALTSGPYHFNDYTPAGVAPDYAFAVGSTDSEFGFAVSGSDVVQRYKNNGSACNAGSNSTAYTCWDGLSTTPTVVSERHSSNHPSGTDTTFYYQAGIGTNKVQEPGLYSASLVITATAL